MSGYPRRPQPKANLGLFGKQRSLGWPPGSFFRFPLACFRHILRRRSRNIGIFLTSSVLRPRRNAVRRVRRIPAKAYGRSKMLICDLLKNQNTISAKSHQTVLEVARLMVEHNIGAVPVLLDGRLVGIFSERDL